MPVEQLAQSLQPLVFSGLSRVQHDLEHTAQMYHKALCAMATAVFPFLLLFLFIAEDFIVSIYGEKWQASALPLQVMIIGAFASMVSVTLQGLSAAQNMVAKEVPIHFASLVLTVLLVTLLAPYGLLAVAAGISLKEIVLLLLLKRMIARSRVGLGWRRLIYAVMPPFIACTMSAIITGITVWSLADALSINPFIRMTIISMILLTSYGLLILGLYRIWRTHAGLNSAVSLVLQVLKRFPVIGRFLAEEA